MNGINMNTLFGNTQLFGAQNQKKVTGKTTDKNKTTKKSGEIQDTVDISGQSREIKKAGYSKPTMKVQNNLLPKALDEDGIQEGVRLSDAAKDLLKSLKEKYGNMDFYVASTNSEEEQAYYMNQGEKEFSVLIDPETLESMAADEEILAKYESILSGADENFAKLKEEIGEENMDSVKSIGITFDKDGKYSYVVDMIDEMNERQSKAIRVKADSVEELAKKIKEKIETQKEKLEEAKEKKTEETQ